MYIRYLLAFFISFSAHALLFSQPEKKQTLQLQAAQSASIPLQFVSAPIVEKKAPVVTKPEPVVEKKVTPQKPIKKNVPKRIVKTEPKKKKVEKKTVKKKEVQKEVVAKAPTPPKEIKKEQPKPVAKTVSETKKVDKVAKKQSVEKAPSQESPGLNSEPTLIQKSRFLSPPTPPKYPRIAKRRGIEGTVTYEVWLDEKGKLDKVILKNSSGERSLDKAALKAIKKWKFSPHRINGQSIAHRLYVPIKFELER